jgi:hypothetical protein
MNDRPSGADGELEAALQSLRPVAVAVDPLAAAFAAGRRSAQGGVRLWRALACAAALAALAAGWPLASHQSMPVAPTQVVLTQAPHVEHHRDPWPGFAINPAAPESNVLRLQQAIFNNGPDALPPVRGSAAVPTPVIETF